MAAPIDSRRASDVSSQLVEAGTAFRCLCSSSELREMPVNPNTLPEPAIYDGRCRKLSEVDRAALEKMGRKARVRVVVPEQPDTIPGIDALVPVAHFTVVEADGSPTALFSSVLSARDAKANSLLVDGQRVPELAHWLVIAQALGWELPTLRILPPWLNEAGQSIGSSADGLTISELRARGFHPTALLNCAARAGWDPGKATTLEDMTAAFDLQSISPDSPVLEMSRLLQLNGDTLRALTEAELVQAIGEHLERKGYPFTDRDPAWQQRFTKIVSKTMATLSDTELWASLLLTSTADYDREVARVLRSPTTQALITEFEKAVDSVGNNGEDARSWRIALADFRRDASAPGRALSTIRQVLTGQREGPGLPPILALLGVEGCRQRLEKARRYATS